LSNGYQTYNVLITVTHQGMEESQLHSAALACIRQLSGIVHNLRTLDKKAALVSAGALSKLKTALHALTKEVKILGRRVSRMEALGSLYVKAPGPPQMEVPLSEGVGLKALVLAGRPSPEQLAAIPPGELFYIPDWDQFAVRIGSCVLRANIGQILSNCARGARRIEGPNTACSAQRAQTRECRKRVCQKVAAVRNNCHFYHDPALYEGSLDTRNYTADSWVYCGPCEPTRYGCRSVGTIEHLGTDVGLIGAEDARRFRDQASHDLLCALVLHRYDKFA
jgi:hypothetical protein